MPDPDTAPVLLHFSDDPAIPCFQPRELATRPGEPPLVWAIDAEHAPLYYFPRDCPRVAYWALPDSTAGDIERFLGLTAAHMVIAIEGCWLARLRETKLYVYHLPASTFASAGEREGPGYYVSRAPVTPAQIEPAGDLLNRLVAAGVELRVTPSLWPLWNVLKTSSLHWSGIRLRNAAPESAP